MLDYLYQTSDLNLFAIISSILLLISIASLFLIRWFFPLHLRYQDNAVIGCTSALIGLIYGVIAGFATAHLINTNNLAIEALNHEANSIANIYRDSRWLNGPVKIRVQADIKQYLDEVLKTEWPLMNAGKTVTSTGGTLIDQISEELRLYKISNNGDAAVIADMLDTIRNLYDGRQQRIELSYESLSVEIWVVILIGTILTLCISYLFGVNFRLHIFTVCASALMMSAIIFLLISLDKPFQGEYVVGPDAYQNIYTYMNKN